MCRSPRLASAETRCPAGLAALPSARVRASSRLPVAPPGRPGGGEPPAVCVAHSAASLLAVTGSTGGPGPSVPRATLASHVHGAAAAPAGATRASSSRPRTLGIRRRVMCARAFSTRRARRRHSAAPKRNLPDDLPPLAGRVAARELHPHPRRRWRSSRLRRTLTTIVRVRRAFTVAVLEPSSSALWPLRSRRSESLPLQRLACTQRTRTRTTPRCGRSAARAA